MLDTLTIECPFSKKTPFSISCNVSISKLYSVCMLRMYFFVHRLSFSLSVRQIERWFHGWETACWLCLHTKSFCSTPVFSIATSPRFSTRWEAFGCDWELQPLPQCKAMKRHFDKVDFPLMYCAIWWPHWIPTIVLDCRSQLFLNCKMDMVDVLSSLG